MILASLPGISSGWSVTLDAASGQLWELCEQPVTILEEPVSMRIMLHSVIGTSNTHLCTGCSKKHANGKIVQDK